MCIVVRIIIVLFFSLQEDDGKKEPEEPEHSGKLFIGGLSYQSTNESLKAYFEKWGDIIDVAVMKDPKTNKYVLLVTQINLMSWQHL
jgi:RNA recognition motif-containing protein